MVQIKDDIAQNVMQKYKTVWKIINYQQFFPLCLSWTGQ